LRSRVVFLLARLIPSLLAVVTTAVLTRLLAPAEYGFYALGLSIVFFLTLGVFEWLGLSLLRMAPATKQPDLFFGTVLTCFCALCGLCIVGAVLVLVLGGLGRYIGLTAACLAATFAAAWLELNQRLQLAELREIDFFRTSFGRGVATVTLVSATAYLYRSAPLILLALGASFLLASLLVREPRLTLLRFRFDLAVCRTLFRFGVPLSISVGLGTILMSVDKWLLQGLSGAQAVGLFTAATLVAQVPIATLAGGIGIAAYSMAVQAVEFGSPESARAQLARNFVVLFGIIVPAATGIIALSNNLAHLMVGQAYWDTVVLLAPWLSAAAVLAGIRAFYVDIAFQLAHRTSALIWTMLVPLAVNIALDIWLIPVLNELGAALGSFGALMVSLIVAAIASRRVFPLPIPFADSAKVLASAGVMFSVLHELTRFLGILALAGQIIIGSVIYLSGIIAFDVSGVRKWLIQHLAGFYVKAASCGRGRAAKTPDRDSRCSTDASTHSAGDVAGWLATPRRRR